MHTDTNDLYQFPLIISMYCFCLRLGFFFRSVLFILSLSQLRQRPHGGEEQYVTNRRAVGQQLQCLDFKLKNIILSINFILIL